MMFSNVIQLAGVSDFFAITLSKLSNRFIRVFLKLTSPSQTMDNKAVYLKRPETQDPSTLSTIGLLETSASSVSSELLGLGTARIRNKEGSVVCEQDLLDLILGSLINVCHNQSFQSVTSQDQLTFLEVGDDGLGDGLANS